MNKKAIAIVRECLKTQNTILNLGHNHLSDEDFIEGSELQQLLQQCRHITVLNLKGNKISEIKGLENLSSLQQLNFSNNQITEIKGVNHLFSLQQLRLDNNAISNIGGLNGLSSLLDLNLNNNRLTNTTGLNDLPSLTHLYLNNNRLSEINSLDNLRSLVHLYLNNNRLTEIKEFSSPPSLTHLYLNNNWLSEIKDFSSLFTLSHLYLNNNRLTKIKGLKNLPLLSHLHLSNNQLTEISSLNNLPSLIHLDISRNAISNIKPLLPWLQRIPNPCHLILKEYDYEIQNNFIVHANPITIPPIEILQQGDEAVIRFLSEQLEPAYEAKLLVVGEPESGKSSIIKKLLDSNYPIPTQEDSTIGIQVVKWHFQHINIPQVMLNVWDFGGQEIQYLTHQFFLSSDALYILLTSARKDFDNLDYWFNIISLLGKNEKNENSTLIVVSNEINMEEGQMTRTFDIKRYEGLYPYLPFTFHSLSLATKDDEDGRFATLQHIIKEKLMKLPIMGRQLPVKWGTIRKKMSNLKINYLHINEYLNLCKESDVEEKFALDLSNYLHKIGEIVHFQNDYTVDNFVILTPKWAVDGIYSILKQKEIEKNGGHFTQRQVYTIWEKDNYTLSERSMLLNLMVKDSFEVAYKIPNKAEEYIAPQLLPIVQPEYEWNKADVLHFRYLYPFMPKGIITRLIVRLHENIKYNDGKGLVWRSGVLLEKLGCIAKVEETKIVITGQQVISIEIMGYKPHRKLLLYDICRTIEGIHKDAFSKIIFERQVPCICKHCKNLKQPNFFDYSELMQYIDDRIDRIRCKLKPKNESEIKSLLQDVFDIDFTMIYKIDGEKIEVRERNIAVSNDPFGVYEPSMKKKHLFISYSKHDETYKEEFHKHLVTLKEEGLLSSFNCKETDLGAEWDATIQHEINKCDIMICLVSVDFLNTDYIRRYEVEKAIEKGKQLIPIIIKPCDWENSNIGRLYAPLRGKSISLDQELFLRNIIKETTPIERAAWWTAIVKELREKVFKKKTNR